MLNVQSAPFRNFVRAEMTPATGHQHRSDKPAIPRVPLRPTTPPFSIQHSAFSISQAFSIQHFPTHPHARGVVHTYQGYDPVNLPGPMAKDPDLVSGAFDHLLAYGSTRRLTAEELARAVKLDPSQIAGLGPSIEALIAMLEERKRKLLERYETEAARNSAAAALAQRVDEAQPPAEHRKRFERAVRHQQLRELESIWSRLRGDRGAFAGQLLRTVEAMADAYRVERLASKYDFTGREPMTVERAIEVLEELEEIDRLLEQLREAMENAQIGVIDLDELAKFADQMEIDNLQRLREQVDALVRAAAERQGIEQDGEGFRLTPAAHRIFRSKILTTIFESLRAGRSGRHESGPEGEGATETAKTRPYEFGDALGSMDVTQSMVNALLREGSEGRVADGRGGLSQPSGRIGLQPRDIEIHRTRNRPRCATSVILDMSGSMRHGMQYVNAKRMALAIDGLVRSEYPGDHLSFVEMYSLARLRPIAEIPSLMPRPVSIFDPVVRLRADLSDPQITEMDLPQHFTNIQRALQLARQVLSAQDTPNRTIALITDGLPTAHLEGEQLYLLYPPHPRTEEATMREAMRCRDAGIVINMFLIPSWSQTEEDVQFAHRMVETTGGRVFFTAGKDLDRFVVWDYVNRRRSVIG